jgi:hypothetical protein
VYEGFGVLNFLERYRLSTFFGVRSGHIPATTSKKPAKPASLFLLVLLEASYSATFSKPQPAKPVNQQFPFLLKEKKKRK